MEIFATVRGDAKNQGGQGMPHIFEQEGTLKQQ